MTEQLNEQLQNLITINPSELLFLCGAGISLDAPTSLPTVNTFILATLKKCGIDQVTIDKVCQKFGETNYRFESLVDEIRKMCDEDLMLAKLFNSSTYNRIHAFLATMLYKGASIITTNFDNCIENACVQNKLTIGDKRIVYKGKDLESEEELLHRVLVKIHGSHPLDDEPNSEFAITIGALAKTDRAFASFPNWHQYLLNLIAKKTIVVMGYSCSDDFDVVPLLYESNPEKVIWLNFDFQKEFPSFTNKITNNKIADLSKSLPLAFFNGQLIPFLCEWSKEINICLSGGTQVKPFTVDDYILLNYQTVEKRQILCNEILLSYGLYTDIIFSDKSDINPILQLQEIKAQFRLGEYDQVIVLYDQVKKMNTSPLITKNLLYYLSSALYYKRDYSNALEVAKECVICGWRMKDMIFYLNALINYASILYSYASTLPADKQDLLLDSAERKFRIVLRRAKGINIEAIANALWGLGDLERYRGNISQAVELLNQSFNILRKIGNVYAIKQLESIIQDIENNGY